MHNKFIHEVLLPYFQCFNNTDLDIALFDLDGALLYTTPVVAAKLDITLDKLLGIAYKNVTPEIIMQACTIHNINDVTDILHVTKQIAQIHDVVITEQIAINYIDFIPYKNYYEAHTVTHFPLFDHDGKVVAAQHISTKFYLFGVLDYLNTLVNKNPLQVLKNNISQDNILPVRQHEVLFLLLCGMSQNDIAVFLNLARGTVSRIVNRLCGKFDIDGINIQLLLKRAKKMHWHEFIPQSLNKPRIIILDPQIQAKYFKS